MRKEKPGKVAKKINAAMKSTKKIVANVNKAFAKPDPAKQAKQEIHQVLNTGKSKNERTELFMRYMNILNCYGPGSKVAREFLREHRKNRKLLRMCKTALVIRMGVAEGAVPAPRKYQRLAKMRLREEAKK